MALVSVPDSWGFYGSLDLRSDGSPLGIRPCLDSGNVAPWELDHWNLRKPRGGSSGLTDNPQAGLAGESADVHKESIGTYGRFEWLRSPKNSSR
jgi:hypothetical protein